MEIYALKSCLKEIKNYKVYEIDTLIDEITKALNNKLNETSGTKLKELHRDIFAYYENIYRIRFDTLRLVFEKKKDSITLIKFGKKDDTFYHRKVLPAVKRFYESNCEKIIPITEPNYSDESELKHYFSHYNYIFNLTDKQKNILDNQSQSHFSLILGVPGSGKTILSAELSKRNITEAYNFTILVILPNKNLVNFYANYLEANRIDKNRIIHLTDIPELELRNNCIHLCTFNKIRTDILDLKEDTIKLNEKKAIDCLNNYLSKLPGKNNFQSADLLSLVNAYFDDNNQKISTVKDNLAEDFKDRLNFLDENISKIQKTFDSSNIRIRKDFGYELIEKFKEPNFIDNYLNESKCNLLIIIDEIQDYLMCEWKAFAELTKNYNKKNENRISLLYLGDEKQRINRTGFSKATISSELGYDNFTEELSENFRVTKRIANLIELIEKNTIKNKGRNLKYVKKDDCQTLGNHVNVIEADKDSLIEAINSIFSNLEVGNEEKFTIISSDIDEFSDASLKNNVISLDINLAKGTEWDSIIIFQPFQEYLQSLNDRQLNTEDNYKLYTLFTRSTNNITLILNTNEFDWFNNETKTMYDNPFKLYRKGEYDFEKFKEIILNSGLSEISEENQMIILGNKIEKLENSVENSISTSELNSILWESRELQEFLLRLIELTKSKDVDRKSVYEEIIKRNNPEERQFLKAFWKLEEKKRLFAYKIVNYYNFETMGQIISNEIINTRIDVFSIFMDYIKNEKEKKQPQFKSKFHKELFMQIFESDINDEELLVYFLKTKLNSLDKLIME